MSDPNSPSSGKVNNLRGLTKYVRRVSRALMRSKSSRDSIPTATSAEPTNSGIETTVPPPSSTIDITSITTPNPVPDNALTEVSPNRGVDHRNQTRQERARALFAKYGLTLEDHEWFEFPREPVERVEKPIRMRVRRQCHRCLTTFGADKICSNCQHVRCQACPRYPRKRSKEDKEARASTAADGAAGGSSGIGVNDEVECRESLGPKVMTIPRWGREDLVRRMIVQRVRRNCHVCGTMFVNNATECRLCQHARCKDCPREPAKFHKYPDGYPGDEEAEHDYLVRQWKKPRVRVRWTCHACNSLFIQGSKTCANCTHDRCETCTRQPPVKVKPPPDPEVLRSVEGRLTSLAAESQGVGESAGS